MSLCCGAPLLEVPVEFEGDYGFQCASCQRYYEERPNWIPFTADMIRTEADAIAAMGGERMSDELENEPTELHEIIERFADKLDSGDISDLSRMVREYALNVHESRLEPELNEPRELTNDDYHDEKTCPWCVEMGVDDLSTPLIPPTARELSKEWLDELIRTKVNTRTTGASWGAQALAEAILESRRAPSGPLSDPEGDLILREEAIAAIDVAMLGALETTARRVIRAVRSLRSLDGYSEPSIYSHDPNALLDNELPGMWEHADYEGGESELLRPLSDEPRENENQTVAAPVLGGDE